MAHKILTKSAAVLALVALGLLSSAASAADVTAADLRAFADALGFLDGLPRGGLIDVAVVYAPDNGDAKNQAAQTVVLLNAIPGPNETSFKAVLLTVKELSKTSSHLNAAFLMPSAMTQGAALSDVARRHRVLTVSTDPSCLTTGCCVLMVHASARVQIVLESTMAGLVGANFSSVFKMMVERR